MLCCVIAGALFALVTAKLGRVPILGAYLRARQSAQVDASAWRLNPSNAEGRAEK